MVQARVQRAFHVFVASLKVPGLSLSSTCPTCWTGGSDAIGRGLVDHGTVRPVRGRLWYGSPPERWAKTACGRRVEQTAVQMQMQMRNLRVAGV